MPLNILPGIDVEITLCLSVMNQLVSLGAAVDSCGDSPAGHGDGDDDGDGDSDGDGDRHHISSDGAIYGDDHGPGSGKRSVTALAAAIECGFPEAVLMLLEARADPNSTCWMSLDHSLDYEGECEHYRPGYRRCSALMVAAHHRSIPDI
jgi:hypothetical protein